MSQFNDDVPTARSTAMREFSVGELRQIATTHPSPLLSAKVQQLREFADHQRVTVQEADIFPAGVPAEWQRPAPPEESDAPPVAVPAAASPLPAVVEGSGAGLTTEDIVTDDEPQ